MQTKQKHGTKQTVQRALVTLYDPLFDLSWKCAHQVIQTVSCPHMSENDDENNPGTDSGKYTQEN